MPDNCYMTLDVSSPYKSLDFGNGDYIGSVTTWHELLQLTAPDDECGVVFARGDFPDSAESILARAQPRNQREPGGEASGSVKTPIMSWKAHQLKA